VDIRNSLWKGIGFSDPKNDVHALNQMVEHLDVPLLNYQRLDGEDNREWGDGEIYQGAAGNRDV
jgi:hypothetical protein